MKNSFLLFTLFLVGASAHAQLVASDPIIVASQDAYGNVRPRIALNAANEPIVIWCNSANEKLYASKMEDGVFTAPIQLNPDGIGISSFDWYGPEIASAGNKIAVVMKMEPEMESHCYVVLSEDGGASWSETFLVENSLPLMSRMPSIAMDDDGNPFITFLRDDMAGFSEWAIAKSADGGESFLEPVSTSINFTDAVCDCCPSQTIVSDGKTVVLYRNNEDNLRDIRASISFDNGLTFPQQADMDDLNWEIMSCPSSGPSAYVANDKIYSTWMSDASGETRVYFSSYDISNDSFEGSTEIFPTTENLNQNYPCIAGNETIRAIAFENMPTGPRDVHFYYSTSNNGFEQSNFIDLTGNLSGNQQRPHMVYANGVFHIVYTDNGGDAVVYQSISEFVGVENELREEPSITIAPNPTSNIVTISLPESIQNKDATVSVMDAQGMLVYSASLLQKTIHSFSTLQFANGTYTLLISINSVGIASKQFVIQH
ncbi:MAG: T9SS type A sorting domain-containing protein [Flavobacteriales bacterium]